MPITRRQFIKRSAGAVAVGMIAPGVWLRRARASTPEAAQGRKFVVIELTGGNDGFNTVVPYSNSRYHNLRPMLSFKEADLKDDQGSSMIISSEFGLHPAMSRIKQLYDEGKVAIVPGVGYPNPNLSHFASMDIWHTADITGLSGSGWLGRYADIALIGETGLSAAALGFGLPKSFNARQVIIPNIFDFDLYRFITDPVHPDDHINQLNAFNKAASRSFSSDTFLGAITDTAFESVNGAEQVQAAIAGYRSAVVYPENNPLALGFKMVAQLITTIPAARMFYVQMHGFDTHSGQIGGRDGQTGKLVGDHARLLRWFSEAVRLFYDDLSEHGLADQVLMMQWSEFGRRPEENASLGTDHGTAAPMFIIGNPARGGLYGEQPSLAASDLDIAGNVRFKVDFREVYATILDKWLEADSRAVLGAQFPHAGFI
jgi:uncharacterized protein (DUF1501 family)